MNKDQLTTLAGAITAVGLAVAAFYPSGADMVTKVSGGIAAIAVAILGFYTNKS